jgi:uncharacterized protein
MNSTKIKLARWYRGNHVPMAAIRKFASAVGRQFQPNKIYLFGSRAYGRPHADSDVDILVVMPARNQLDQAVKIELACDPPFPLDILVRTPANFERGLADGDSLLREIVANGKLLYEKNDARMGSQGRRGSRRREKSVSERDSTA